MNATLTQFEKFLEQSKPLSEQYGRMAEYDNLYNLIKEGAKQELVLMVCGEFKRGKSSFVNALLGQELCPVAAGIATSAVSIIHYGEKEKAVRHYSELVTGEHNEEKLVMKEETVSFDHITQFAKGTVDEIGNTMFIELTVPNPLLKDGLVIIDTPGVGSLDPRHLFLTMQALPKADAFFFVTDTGEPMTTTELDFVKNNIVSTNKPFDVLLSKSDQVSKEELERYKTDTESKLMICCNKKVDCIPVSSTEWDEFNKTGSERRKMNSNCEAIYSAISSFRTRREQLFAELFRERFVVYLEGIKQQATVDFEALNNNNDKEIESLKQRLNDLGTFKNLVTNENSDFRLRINSIIESSQEKVMQELSRESVLLSTERLEEILNMPEATRKGGEDFVTGQINDAIKKLSRSLDNQIDRAMSEVMAELKHYVDSIRIERTAFNGGVDGVVPISNSISDKIFNLQRNTNPSMGAAVFASVVGGIVLGGVGLYVGIAAGIFYVVKSLTGARKAELVNNIRKQVSPRITIAMGELRAYVQKRYYVLQKEVVNSLHSVVDSMTQQMQATVQMMQECQQNNQKKAAKAKEIQGEITLMDNLITQVRVCGTNRFAKK